LIKGLTDIKGETARSAKWRSDKRGPGNGEQVQLTTKGCSKRKIFIPLLYVFYSELVGKYLVCVVLKSYNLEAYFAGDHLQNSVRK